MVLISLVSWLDSHAGAITALATVVLVLITAAYVVVTYWLVREQRSQAHVPEIEYDWADRDQPFADLRLHNIGNDTATEVTIVRGPGACVDVEMSKLGQRTSLLAGSGTNWPIRPLARDAGFADGDLSLTITYFGNNCSRAFFRVLLLQFGVAEGRYGFRDAGSVSDDWTGKQLRRLTARSLGPWRRPAFRWRTRKMDPSILLLEAEVRNALHARLTASFEKLQAWSARAEAYRRDLGGGQRLP